MSAEVWVYCGMIVALLFSLALVVQTGRRARRRRDADGVRRMVLVGIMLVGLVLVEANQLRMAVGR